MRRAFLKAVGLASVVVLAQAGSVQLPGLTVPSSAAADRASVVQIFCDSYNAYKCVWEISRMFVPKPDGDCRRKFSFGHDEVAPLSKQPLDPRNGWGATIVDAMGTMVCGTCHLSCVAELNNDLSTSWD